MRPTVRVALLGLGIAALGFVAAVAIMPTHVSFGAGSLRCGTVLRPDRTSEIHMFCGKAGARQLRAAGAEFAGLALVALIPLLAGRKTPVQWRGRIAIIWLVLIAVFATIAVTGLGLVEYSPPSGGTYQL